MAVVLTWSKKGDKQSGQSMGDVTEDVESRRNGEKERGGMGNVSEMEALHSIIFFFMNLTW